MGTGASKNNDNDSSSSDSSDEDEYTSRFTSNNATKKNSTLKPLNVSSNNKKENSKNKLNAKSLNRADAIVGYDDSDNELGGNNPNIQEASPARRLKAQDTELTNEIQDLENTLTSMGLKEDGGSSVRHKNEETFYDYAKRRPKRTADLSRSMSNKNYYGNRTNTKLKFSWDENPGSSLNSNYPNKESEEWTYKKVSIEGFDPDKFRKVNNGKISSTLPPQIESSGPTSMSSKFNHHAPPPPPRGISFDNGDMPGVPTYDRSEQQILAALEREMGVL